MDEKTNEKMIGESYKPFNTCKDQRMNKGRLGGKLIFS